MAEEKNFGLSIENARIIFRNFSGKESQYNRAGVRNFAIVLEPEDAERLKADGWNIKPWPKVPSPDRDQILYLPVEVSYKDPDRFPVTIYLITNKGKRRIPEKFVNELDSLRFSKIDLAINPSHWEVNGKTGIKAYLRSFYGTVEETDPLAYNYENVPDLDDSFSPDDDIPF